MLFYTLQIFGANQKLTEMRKLFTLMSDIGGEKRG